MDKNTIYDTTIQWSTGETHDFLLFVKKLGRIISNSIKYRHLSLQSPTTKIRFRGSLGIETAETTVGS